MGQQTIAQGKEIPRMTHITVTITDATGFVLHEFKVATKYPILTANAIRKMAVSVETITPADTSNA